MSIAFIEFPLFFEIGPMFVQSMANVLKLICVLRAAGVREFEWE